MGTLSANTLFHFTGTKDNLISILQNGFYPRYRLENPLCLDENSSAFPIVCFCDIPLSQIQNHSGVYGKYALGLTKEWSKKMGVCPILYTNRGSVVYNNIMGLINMLNEAPSENNEYKKKLSRLLYSTISYIKPYEEKGQLNIRYYDEREWRYSIGINNQDVFNDVYLSKEDFNDATKRDAANNKMIKYKLDFEPKDINYIIVPTDSEVLQIMEEVNTIKGKFPYDDVKLLTTRIISMERIKEDF